jgi:hypothetical protein
MTAPAINRPLGGLYRVLAPFFTGLRPWLEHPGAPGPLWGSQG